MLLSAALAVTPHAPKSVRAVKATGGSIEAEVRVPGAL